MSGVQQQQRVLVVDDDREIREVLVRVLRQGALLVDDAADGGQALELLRENSYAVVLLDLMLPVADGFAVLNAMSHGVTEQPVVLVITGADRTRIDQLDPRRIHGIIRKPFDPFEVAAVVAACADIRSRGRFETMALAMISGAPILASILTTKW